MKKLCNFFNLLSISENHQVLGHLPLAMPSKEVKGVPRENSNIGGKLGHGTFLIPFEGASLWIDHHPGISENQTFLRFLSRILIFFD